MGYFQEIRNSDYASTDTALRNRMSGVQNHSAVGYILATQLPGVVQGVMEGNSIFGNLTMSNKTQTDEVEDNSVKEDEVNNQKNAIQEYKTAYNAFVANPSKNTAAKLKEACDNANSRSIEAAFKEVTKNPKYAEFFGKK